MKPIKNVLLLVFMFMVGCGSITPTNAADNIEIDINPIATPPLSISNTCLQEENVNLENLNLSGKILLSQDKRYRLFDATIDSFVDIPENAYLSPNGEKIAQYDKEKKGIKVSTLTGELIVFFSQDAQWLEANSVLYGDTSSVQFRWWDNNFLYIRSLPVGSQLMLNINTGETHEIEFPYSKEVWAFGGSIDIRDNYVSFSPDLEKVIYASTMSLLVLRNNSIYPDGTWRTVAWVGFSPTYTNPSWSPDGSKLIFVTEGDKTLEDLYGIDTNAPLGERKLTDLNKLFNSPYQIWISQFNWSPDGEKIALIARVTPNEGGESLSRLLVLDVETGNIEDYCNPDTPYTSDSFSFTWSPDGKYISTDTTIVDLESRIAYKFPDLYIVDWVGEGKNR